MKKNKKIFLILLSIIFVLLFQNIKMYKLIKIADNLANDNAHQQYLRLEYILNHYDYDLNDSVKKFIQCAETIRKNCSIQEKQLDLLEEYASISNLTDFEKKTLLWSTKKTNWIPGRYLPLKLLEDAEIGWTIDYYFVTQSFVNKGCVINIAQKDTVCYGELYESNLKFVFEDTIINNMYMVSTEEIDLMNIEKNKVDTLKNGHYQVIARKKGNNTLYGLYKIERYRNTSFYPFQINYYVE